MIKYEIRRNKRNKHIKISVKEKNKVLVTYPWWANRRQAIKFIKEKQTWIEKSVLKMNKVKNGYLLRQGTQTNYLEKKEEARKLVKKKLNFFSTYLNTEFKVDLSYNRISIRNQKTRWGSCSEKNNLNFNWRIILLPEEMQDYLIVHELCHLRHMNHSKKFWELVGRVIPDYQRISKQLRRL